MSVLLRIRPRTHCNQYALAGHGVKPEPASPTRSLLNPRRVNPFLNHWIFRLPPGPP